MSHYRVNRLLQELFSVPGNLVAFRTDRAAVYAHYGLDAAEQAALDSGDPAALTGLGVHPMLQMHLVLAADPKAGEYITARAYLDRGEH